MHTQQKIEAMTQKDRQIPMLIASDFNAHVKDHYSTTTNENGKLLLKITKLQKMHLINTNYPTFERPDTRPT